MPTLYDHYKVLGVSYGAGIADVTASYKRLCRIYHPDVNSDPESEELMKRINIAYSVLRDKLRREAAVRERAAYYRTTKRYSDPDTQATWSDARKANAEAEKGAYTVIHEYFKAINSFDYPGAYEYLSSYDKRRISRESFIKWRESVARLFPMREFKVESSSTAAVVTFNNEKTLNARKFMVMVTEEDLADNTVNSGDVEKLVISENGEWRIFLGYRNVAELTREFDERFRNGLKRDVAKQFDEYYAGLCPEYNMFSLAGMRKAVSREMYRQKRFGGTLTFAAISVSDGSARGSGQEELQRSAAKTINNSLRETDVPAYAGDGVFVILFVELKRKNAEEVVSRLSKKIRGGAGVRLGGDADIEYAFETWSGGGFADFDSMNKVLKKFYKKL